MDLEKAVCNDGLSCFIVSVNKVQNDTYSQNIGLKACRNQ
jgi:xanthine/uracil permease